MVRVMVKDKLEVMLMVMVMVKDEVEVMDEGRDRLGPGHNKS